MNSVRKGSCKPSVVAAWPWLLCTGGRSRLAAVHSRPRSWLLSLALQRPAAATVPTAALHRGDCALTAGRHRRLCCPLLLPERSGSVSAALLCAAVLAPLLRNSAVVLAPMLRDSAAVALCCCRHRSGSVSEALLCAAALAPLLRNSAAVALYCCCCAGAVVAQGCAAAAVAQGCEAHAVVSAFAEGGGPRGPLVILVSAFCLCDCDDAG